MITTPDKLDTYIDSLEQLPASPVLLNQLVGVFRQPDREVEDVVAIMRQDAFLTTETLRHANSAFFLHETPVADLFEAVMRLGFYEVYQIAVTKLGAQMLASSGEFCTMDVSSLWRHSLITGVTAGLIGKKVGEDEGGSFTAGLLHDVGKVVISSAEGLSYTALLKQCRQSGEPLVTREETAYGFDHAKIGSRLMQRWGLPGEICSAVQHHHGTEPDVLDRLGAVICLGNFMAHVADAVPHETPRDPREALDSMETLQLEEKDLESILMTARDEIKRLSGAARGPV